MKVLVIGYGVSGKSATALLKSQGHDVVVVDRKAEGTFRDTPDFPLDGFSQIILSPGIPTTHPLVQRATQLGIEVIGEIELGLRNLDNRCFAVTGANGKTTTVLMTAHILNQAGKKARAVGNVGEPLTSHVGSLDEIFILELSSFQLETLHCQKLEAAIVLNITPNHLDRYPSMQEYVQAKSFISRCLKKEGDLFISDQVKQDWGVYFEGAKNFEKEVDLIKIFGYMQLGMASKQSATAAYLLCKRCGVTDVEFLQGLKTFKKPPHRIEWVAKINEVSYYNDSKSSNVHSVIHAVGQFDGPIVLIIGGLHKGSSYRPWIESFEGKVRKIIAYGQAAPIMKYELASFFDFEMVELFAGAVKKAKEEAKHNETVLLSPGCSSYDQFPSYEHRGDEFKRLVRET